MNQLSQTLRRATLDLCLANAPQTEHQRGDRVAAVLALLDAWLGALEEEDLAGIAPASLAAVLWDGFSRCAGGTVKTCRVEALQQPGGREGHASAFLIMNPDMLFLVDSIVMALRRQRVNSRAVLNAVLCVQRDRDGFATGVVPAGGGLPPGAALESYVLVLLADALPPAQQEALSQRITAVAADAAAVDADAARMSEALAQIARAVETSAEGGAEIAPFLDWARKGGFEPFGYAYYRVEPGVASMSRDLGSRLGVLRDTSHPLYDTSLAGIPEDAASLAARPDSLSVVKADVLSTLHRDQQLDFFGVRHVDAGGTLLGEHCFLGLFSRAAMATPLSELPFARGRIARVLKLAGVRSAGFRAEKFLEILESLPRTEVLEAGIEWLANVCSTLVALYKQPRAMVFVRPDLYGRHLNVLVYLPRERYSAVLAERLSIGLRSLTGAADVRTQTLLADGPLARVHLIARGARLDLDPARDIAAPMLAAVEGWHTTFEQLVDGATDADLRSALRAILPLLPNAYQNSTPPRAAFADLCVLLGSRPAAPGQERVRVHIDASTAVVTIRLLAERTPPSLSQILPALHNAGVAVDREQTFHIDGLNGEQLCVTVLVVDAAGAARLAQPSVADAARELFESLLNNEAEDGRLNGLVIEAGLRQKEAQLLRAYASYWRQAGCRFSLRYIADCLRKQPVATRSLVDAFKIRFNPALSEAERAAGTAALHSLKQGLPDLNHPDAEDILRGLADLALATLRTSYFQDTQSGDTILFKFDSSGLALLPQPRPHREIFVFSRRFEGVHLRGGPVARGGLRWSDRMEDYRTEVLGLVKAQMVKNAVIVPVGAKGGFVCKMMPQGAAREVIAAEGEAVYRLFIAGLLDLTDNRASGGIQTPAQTVCYDEADPYLVVAADKGTATFSDIANSIAVQRGFWLGDAFASGGSNGYDHKKLGITAKGAWEAVKRHCYELGHDLDSTPLTVVGVGDMSGDVFGNGMLLSRQLKLVAAFDHRHIFLDPEPDVARSFAERARLFALPRSSWDEYDRSLISAGGGVWPRSARSIALSEPVRRLLDIDAPSLTPEQLMHAILLARVDLFYNGGIGTYIKAAGESHAEVKDRANDALRVDGQALRCRMVAEGGNLGATQSGRIEFALRGGRIFTDAIDNSAGVDCSDHEVNVKIWLDTEVNAGSLSEGERNRILNDLTTDIEALVLRDNTLQTHMLAREDQAQSDPAVVAAYARLIRELEAEGAVSRRLEQLPSDAELQRRIDAGRGLSAPELAVVIANVKNRAKRLLSARPLTSYPWAATLLTPYFPPALVAGRDALDHPLANAILATVLANEAVNRCGPLMAVELSRARQLDETEVMLAWAQAWTALNLAPLFAALDAEALRVPREVSMAVDARTRQLQRAVIQGVLAVPGRAQGDPFRELTSLFSDADSALALLPPGDAESLAIPAGVASSAFLAAARAVDAIAGVADFVFAALTVQRPATLGLPALLGRGMELRRLTGIDALERRLMDMPAAAEQEPLRQHALQALRSAQQHLLLRSLQEPGLGGQKELPIVRADAGKSFEQAVLAAWNLSEAASS